jgi:hypothetical protein
MKLCFDVNDVKISLAYANDVQFLHYGSCIKSTAHRHQGWISPWRSASRADRRGALSYRGRKRGYLVAARGCSTRRRYLRRTVSPLYGQDCATGGRRLPRIRATNRRAGTRRISKDDARIGAARDGGGVRCIRRDTPGALPRHVSSGRQTISWSARASCRGGSLVRHAAAESRSCANWRIRACTAGAGYYSLGGTARTVFARDRWHAPEQIPRTRENDTRCMSIDRPDGRGPLAAGQACASPWSRHRAHGHNASLRPIKRIAGCQRAKLFKYNSMFV